MAKPTWITYATAAEILECSIHRVTNLVNAGRIERRAGHSSGNRPVISRASVLRLCDDLIEESAEAERRRTEKARQAAVRRRFHGEPPDLERDWISATAAARLLGVTRPAVTKRVRRGRLPATEANGRVWLLREHVEQAARVRTAREDLGPEPLRPDG